MLNLYCSNETDDSKIFTKDEWTDINCPQHSHFGLEVVIVLDGEFVVEIENKQYSLGKNEAIIIMPFEMHKFITPEHSRVIIMTVTPSIFAEYKTLLENKSPKDPVAMIEASEFEYIIKHIAAVDGKNTIEINCAFYALLSIFTRNSTFVPSRTPNELFRKAIIYISSHYNENITLKKLAHELNVNYVYLSKVFNRDTKMTFTSFLNSFRIENAIEMLKNTDKSISEIAYECGWGSIRSFNRAFRAELSCTPKEFRSRIGKTAEWCYYDIPNIKEIEKSSKIKL